MTLMDLTLLEKIKVSIKETVIDVIIDTLSSYNANLGEIKVEFDEKDPTVVHITIPGLHQIK